LLASANGTAMHTLSEALIKFLEGDVEHSKVQFCMLPDTTIADAMMQSEIYQNMLCEVNKILVLYFTFPVTTFTAERSFSSLRRIKTYLHNIYQLKENKLFW